MGISFKKDRLSLSSVSLSVIVIILLVTPHCFGLKSSDLESVSMTSPQDIDACPPWYYQQKNKGSCFCSFTTKKLKGGWKAVYPLSAQCTARDSTAQSLVQLGYCMTFDNSTNETLLLSCPYNTGYSHNLHRLYVTMNTTVSNLNQFTCGPLKRADIYCQKCTNDSGPSPFTLDLSCFSCTSSYHGWLLYLLFELFPLTIFLVLVTILKIKPANGYLNSFILLSQVIVALLTFNSETPFLYSLGRWSIISEVLVKTLQTVYGFWNLDFFRHVIPGFCVSPALNNLDVVALQLLSVFYPMSIILTAWLIIHLYERNFRPFVWAWRPFRRGLSHFSVTNNPKKAVVNLFTTFLLFSYSKLVFVASHLVTKVQVESMNPLNGKISLKTRILFLEPAISYFSPQHGRYVALSFFLFFVFILPPPLILLLYPTKWFQKFLNKFCQKSRTIRMFAHACHGCFKNGLNDTRDCRHFAGAYLLLRLALPLCKSSFTSLVYAWLMVSVCFGIATILIAVCRPYKNPYLSALDFFFMLAFTIGSLFAAFVTTNNPTKKDSRFKLIVAVFAFIFVCSILPLLYISCLVSYHLKKKAARLRHLLNLRRRDYLDISDFQYDTENSDIMDQGQTANILRSRVLNSDSFQSE